MKVRKALYALPLTAALLAGCAKKNTDVGYLVIEDWAAVTGDPDVPVTYHHRPGRLLEAADLELDNGDRVFCEALYDGQTRRDLSVHVRRGRSWEELNPPVEELDSPKWVRLCTEALSIGYQIQQDRAPRKNR